MRVLSQRHFTPWSAEDDAEMERLVLMKWTAPQIAPSFPNRTMGAIECRFKKFRKRHGLHQIRGIDRPVWLKQTDAQIFESDVNYEIRRREEAERGCRMLKAAMDRYYANHKRAA